MKYQINIISFCSFLILGSLGLNFAYADDLGFDQDYFMPNHGVRITLDTTNPRTEPVIANVESLKSDGTTVEGKSFTLYLNGTNFYRSDYIRLVETGQSNIDELKVVNNGSIRVSIFGAETISVPVVSQSDEDVNLQQIGYQGLYNIGSIVDCSGSFYGGDVDGDGICDNWENQNLLSGQNGLKISIEGMTETYLFPCDLNSSNDPSSGNYDRLGQSVCPSHLKPDLYFEIDSMKGHSPNQDSLADIVQAFANSPFLITGGNYLENVEGLYKLNGDISDSSGNGFNGQLNSGGTLNFVPGLAGQTFQFDGSTHIETVDDPFDFEFNTPFSIAGWFKTNVSGSTQVLFGKLSAPTGYQLFLKGADGQMRVRISSSDSNKLMLDTSGINVRNDLWHHVALTYDGSGTASGVKIYIDGSEVSLNPVDAGPLTASIKNNIPLIIGNQNPTAPFFFVGEMFGVQIYSHELNEADIDDLLGGISLHFQISDNELPHDTEVTSPGGNGGRNPPGTDALKVVWFGTTQEREQYAGISGTPSPSNFWDNIQRSQKSQVFHYVIFGHDYAGNVGVSGISEIPGNDILVSLGSWDYGVGSQDDQSGSLMHEMGHNLNLHHGGIDYVNCKPNYISVMSYSRQTSDFVPNRPLDFSNHTLEEMQEPDVTIIGQYGTNDLETAYGDQSGNLHLMMTGPTAQVPPGDFNHIINAGCDGEGNVLLTQTDWDPEIMDLALRTDGNWVDGIDVVNNPRPPGKIILQNEQACRNLPEVSRAGERSMLRTCVEETLRYDQIRALRSEYAGGASDIITNFVPLDAEPEPTDKEYCLVQARKILEEIKNNPNISPAQGKQMLEDLLSKFDGGPDDCDIPKDEKQRIFDAILYLYERYASAVPEFETWAIIILSVSLLSVIVLTRKNSLTSQFNRTI